MKRSTLYWISSGLVMPMWVLANTVSLSSMEYAAVPGVDAEIIQQQHLIKQDPQNATLYFKLHRLLLSKHQWVQAQDALEQARSLRLSPRLWKVPLARIYLERHLYQAVLSDITLDTDWIEEDPWAQEVILLRGHAYAALGEDGRAQQSYEQVVAVNPNVGEAWLGLVHLALKKQQYTDAHHYLDKASQASNCDSQALAIAEASTMYEEGDFETAYHGFGEALAQEPGNATALMGMVQLLGLAQVWDEFGAYAQTLHERLPNDPNAQYFHALNLYRTKQWADAKDLLQQVIAEAPEKRTAYVLLANINFGLNHYDAATTALQKLTEFQPTDPENRYYEILMAMAQKDFARASARLEEMKTAVQSSPWTAILKAEYYIGQKDYDSALTEYRRIVSLMPHSEKLENLYDAHARAQRQVVVPAQDIDFLKQDCISYPIVHTLALMERKDYTGAELEAKKAKKTALEPIANYLLGNLALVKNEVPTATKYYKQAAETKGFTVAQLALADQWVHSGLESEAAKVWHQVLAEDPTNVVAMKHLLTLDKKEKLPEKTVRLLEQKASTEKSSPNPGAALVSYYLYSGQSELAYHQARLLIERFPKSSNLLMLGSELAMDHADYARAEEYLLKLHHESPRDTQILQQLVRASYEQDAMPRARQYLKKALQVDPNNLGNIWMQAQVLRRERAYDELIAVANKLIQQDPRSSFGHETLAEANTALGLHEQALRMREKVYALNPSTESVIALAIAQSHVHLDPSVPNSTLESWLVQHPQDVSVRLNLGQRYAREQLYREAIDAYEQVLLAEPHSMVAVQALAELYAHTNVERALKFSEKAYASDPESPVNQDLYGWALVQNGRVKQGLAYINKAAASETKEDKYRYHQALAYYRLGDMK
ncbi:MAG: tetratricopeptide repeat protein, partial [Pseudomonadota bacterium]